MLSLASVLTTIKLPVSLLGALIILSQTRKEEKGGYNLSKKMGMVVKLLTIPP